MNKNKFLFIAGIATVVIIVLIVIIVIININRNNSDDNGSNNSSNDNDIVLQYWGLWEPEDVMQPLIDEYEADNPGVTILYTQKSFTQYEQNAYTRLVEGATNDSPAPDILRINNSWLPKFQDYLYAMPSSVMSTDQYEEYFYPTAVDDFTGSDGKIYAVPLEIDGLALFYNKDLLEAAGYDEPPTDWDTFKEVAIELTKEDTYGNISQYGAGIGAARNVEHSVDIFNLILLQNGVNILSDDGKTVDLANTDAVQSLDYYCSFALEDEVWSADSRSDLELFYSGKLAMMFAPSWRAFDIIDAAPQIEFDIAPLPQLKANDYEIYYSTYWGDAVNNTSPNKEMAWKFVKFLSEKETEQKLYSASSTIRAFGEPYSRVDLKDEMIGKPYVSAIAEMAPYMKSWQMGDETYVKTALADAITSVIENGTDVSVTLKKAESTINSRLAQTNK